MPWASGQSKTIKNGPSGSPCYENDSSHHVLKRDRKLSHARAWQKSCARLPEYWSAQTSERDGARCVSTVHIYQTRIEKTSGNILDLYERLHRTSLVSSIGNNDSLCHFRYVLNAPYNYCRKKVNFGRLCHLGKKKPPRRKELLQNFM